MIIFNYNGKDIKLNYSERDVEKRKFPVETKGYSRGLYEDYLNLEKEAQFYLIKNAIQRRPEYNLDRIIGIKQEEIERIIFDNQPGIRILLTGIAVYRKKEL
jgi:hypothetical protein